MDQPQPCTKCKKLPEDILMLACSHDLCLDCAAQRLAFQMKKKKPANSIVCQICYERTALDSESVAELEKLIPPSKTPPNKSVIESRPQYERERVVPRISQQLIEQKAKDKSYQRQPIRQYAYASQANTASNTNLLSGISTKRSCGDHPDEQILYFCFDCKCECICPECVIHGIHKDHDVKTIKKSAPVVKAELEKSLDKIQSNVQNLLIRKSEAQKIIRTLNEQNAQSKRQIQTAFEEVRAKLLLQQKQILSRYDVGLNDSIQQYEKSIKTIIRRIQELRSYSSTTNEVMKRQELPMLNFYAKKWKQLNEDAKETPINLPSIVALNNDKILTAILELTDYADRLTQKQKRR